MGLGFRVRGVRFRGLDFGLWVFGLGSRVQGSRFRVWGLGFRVQSYGLWVKD